MAEFAAHITDSISSEGRPSLFELFAVDSLSESLKPAFDHCYRVLSISYPTLAEKLHSSHNYIYYGILSIVELNHITRHNASLSEYFYGISRTNSKTGTGVTLSAIAKILSVIELIILPMTKEYLDNLYMSIKENEVDAVNQNIHDYYSTRKLYYLLYPYLHFILRIYRVFLYLRYGFHKTDHPTLLFQLLTMRFRYAKPNPADNSMLISTNTGLVNNALNVFKLGLNAVSYTIPVAVFFVKFLEWWYSQDLDMHRNVTSLPIPPPPRTDKSSIGVQLCSIPSQCPLCLSEQKAPSLLSTSGVLYCYSCIHQHINKTGCCAVTNLPSNIDNIIRVYI